MSRLTFRKADNAIAWQKQLRDNYNGEVTPPVPSLELRDSIVRAVGKKIAKQIILKYEWLGTMSPTQYHFGIFFGDYCAGVTCIGSSCGGGTNIHMPFGIERNELLMLARGANVHWSPPGANSRLVAWSCKLLSKKKIGKMLIAYSDTDAGEIGTIYQACNWVYIGVGSSTVQWVSPIGRIHDAKYPADLRKRQGDKYPRSLYVKMLREQGWKEQRTNPKHRYVMVLDKKDKALVARVESMRQPYPKREE